MMLVRGSVEYGETQKRDGNHGRADLTVGYGDYEKNGFNIVLNAEYQVDGRVTHRSRGFPYDNRDLTSIGGKDGNSGDSSLGTFSTTGAYVTRVAQTDLNNPFAGGTTTLSGAGTSANPAFYDLIATDCPFGTFTM